MAYKNYLNKEIGQTFSSALSPVLFIQSEQNLAENGQRNHTNIYNKDEIQ